MIVCIIKSINGRDQPETLTVDDNELVLLAVSEVVVGLVLTVSRPLYGLEYKPPP